MNLIKNDSPSHTSTTFINQILQQFDGGVVILNPNNNFEIIDTNDYFLIMTGYKRSEIIGSYLSKFTADRTYDGSHYEMLKMKQPFRKKVLHRKKNGGINWHELFHMPINENGEVTQILVLVSDITDSHMTEELMNLERDIHASLNNGDTSEKIFTEISNHISSTLMNECEVAMIFFDDPSFTDYIQGNVNEKLKQELITQQFIRTIKTLTLNNELQRNIIQNNFSHPIFTSKQRAILITYGYRGFWSKPIIDLKGEIIGRYLMLFKKNIEIELTDLNYMRRISSTVSLAVNYCKQRQELFDFAYTDASTGMPNVHSFKRHIRADFSAFIDSYVCIIRPSEYQQIIDVYGTESGNQLLLQIAERIESMFMRPNGIIARHSNTSLIFANPYSRFTKFEDLLNHLIVLSQVPYTIKGKQVYITLKAGKAYIDGPAPDKCNAISRAATALSFSMKENGVTLKTFNPSLQATVTHEMDVLNHLNAAIKRREFIPMLQPKVDIRTGKIIGFEALSRWVSEDLGFVSPATFIPVAEKVGNIHKIDRQTFKYVLNWIKKRQKEGKDIFPVAVNISASHFYYPTFARDVKQLLEKYNVSPKYICLEITESIELKNINQAKDRIEELNRYGIKTSIDDFGIGYSSLSYLQQLNVSEIKIDKSFIDHIENPKMAAVVSSILQLAEALGMVAVAEGIETLEQAMRLKDIGCVVGQGYYFYRPMSFEAIEQILDAPSL